MRAYLLFSLFLLTIMRSMAQEPGVSKISLQGIRSKAGQMKNAYVTAGDRSYLIGTQNGLFPDMGDHVKGEMGGLWCPPFKLADGFWALLTDKSSHKQEWLTTATSFTNYPYGNKIIYHTKIPGIEIERFQFCPNGYGGVLVRYSIRNLSKEKKTFTLTFVVKSELRSVWLPDTTNNDESDLLLNSKYDPFIAAKDSLKNWYLVVTSSSPKIKHPDINNISLPEQTQGMGVTDALECAITAGPESAASVTFALGGSSSNEQDAKKTCSFLIDHYKQLLEREKQVFTALLKRSKITIPDKHLQNVYDWVKINTEWLTREVPGIGRGLSAGYMEYPWWFGCDNTYAIQGLLATGNFNLAKQTLNLLYERSKAANNNGRIAHEISSNGTVGNRGNTQETAHFIMCAGTYLKWTGDTVFVHKLFPYIKSGIHWLLNTMDTNHNMFPEGYGIMEVVGLNAELIDVSVYTQQALESASAMASLFGEQEQSVQYRELALKLKDKINTYFWDAQNQSYCDFFGSREQALTTLKGALKQIAIEEQGEKGSRYDSLKNHFLEQAKAITAMPDSDRGWITNKNWVINTPMETGIAPREKAINALNKIRLENCGPYGPYLSAVAKKYMMTIATGVQAVAECRYGRTDSALWYVDKIAATFNRTLPGSISEMMPDYGCFTQSWTNYGIDIPLISYIFGIQPDALHHLININATIPQKWNNLQIENVAVADNKISLSIKRMGNKVTYTLVQTRPDWHIHLQLPEKYKLNQLNGKVINIAKNEIEIKGKSNIITVIQD